MNEESEKFQKTTSGSGFFLPYFTNFKTAVDAKQVEIFNNLQQDDERVEFIAKILPDCSENLSEINNGKDEAISKEFKDKGNAEFVRGDTSKALASYSKAILSTPFSADSSSDIAVLIANRSAALYHLERFEEAIRDIDFAIKLSYPKELRYKAFERKAKCLLALKNHDEAGDAFKLTLRALDDSKLQTEKKLKMQKDIQIMLNVIYKPKTKQGHINALVPGEKDSKKGANIPAVDGKVNKKYPALSNKVSILKNDIVGRYATAACDIDPGETVAVEPSYCSVLLAEHAGTHCVNCFKRTESPYPCEGCSSAVFCSEECCDTVKPSFHKYECAITNALYRSGASVMVLMALRIITQKDVKYFLDLKPSLEEPIDNLKTYAIGDYLPVYNLVRHENLRPDFLERTAMAVFLLRCLQQVGYFGENSCSRSANLPLTADEKYIGGLILRHLQLLQFNAHEIAELEMDCTESLEKATSIFLGGGLFPSLALFNHSCDPTVVRYFIGKTVIVRAVKGARVGDPVAENYGPLFTVKPREERQCALKSQYWFDCGCQPCTENWPPLKEMNRKVIRFRCDSGGELKCPGIIEVPMNTEEFMPKCASCGKHTNILKGLKALQDTDGMFKQATVDSDRGKFGSALNLYLEILRVLGKYLAPPFYDYHLCQQAVRKCMLSLGSKYTKEI